MKGLNGIKKILYVATTARTHINSFHLPYIQWFKQNDWVVDVATNGDAFIPYVDNQFSISIHRSPVNIKNIKACKQLVQILNEGKYDLISCHTPVGGVIARVAGRIAGVKHIMYTAHGFHFFKGGSKFKNFVFYTIEYLLAHWTDVLVTINDEDFEVASHFRLRNKGKVYKLNGIGVNIVNFSEAIGDRSAYNIAENEIVFTNIGEMIFRKNQIILIKAFSQANIPNSKLIICGDGNLHSTLEKLIFSLGLEKKVLLLGFRNDINNILSMTDIFVFSSLQEGLPVAVIEAMASGLPVICSNVRGCRDLIHENNGIVVPPTDIKAYANAMIKLANSPKLRERFGRNNRILAEKYDIAAALKMTSEIIEDLMSQ